MSEGLWVFVCGPSGAGKDSVLDWTQHRLAGHDHIVFSRRLVTRAPYPGSDHDEVSPSAFHRLQAGGRLAWHWQAHGFSYGVAGSYAAAVHEGSIVVVNGSRHHVAELPSRDGIRVVMVTAAAERVAARLHARGREDKADIERRLARNAGMPALSADLLIRNEADLASAGALLQRYLETLAE